MLILTRKKDTGVRVFDNNGRYICHIVNLGIDGERVNLGFDADPRFVIVRDELLDTDKGPIQGRI